MKKEDMKNKTILLVEFEKIYPELDEETQKKNKKEGIISYFLNKDKIVSVTKAFVYFIDVKKDPLDETKICKLQYRTEDGKTGVVRVKNKTTFTEILPDLYIDSELEYLTDQVKNLLKS